MSTTYHGITKIECLVCGHFSTVAVEMEMWNDMGLHCPTEDHDNTDMEFTSIDGEVRRLTSPTHDNTDPREVWTTVREADFTWVDRDKVAGLLPTFSEYFIAIAGYGYGYEIPTRDGHTLVVSASDQEDAGLFVGVMNSNGEWLVEKHCHLLDLMKYVNRFVREFGLEQELRPNGECRFCDTPELHEWCNGPFS